MSESSSAASRDQGDNRTCYCELIANHFTATTPLNGGRRFYKCRHYETNGCHFWEWRDEELPPHVSMFIHKQKLSLNALRQERNNLRKMVDDMVGGKAADVNNVSLEEKVSNLEQKLKRWKRLATWSWILFAIFVAGRMM
ncbi:hypothetical protein A4A49_05128 [Nicotiana attenuata]|uniref:GRF-type domain-containing protein n=1 Tax=Nicotiana attenuata TaxID=49451 RepID=A0A1J6IKI1_NICAT|nr:hypothetical protein A4A49_05128 [Nicotiana attenuata]